MSSAMRRLVALRGGVGNSLESRSVGVCAPHILGWIIPRLGDKNDGLINPSRRRSAMRTIASMMMVALLGVPAAALADCPPDVGAALAAACPCGADSNSQAWKNHGQYVKCVVQFRNDMRKQECADKATLRTIARCAARSTCGKEDAILCC